MPVDGSTFLTTASVSAALFGVSASVALLFIFMPAISSAASAAPASVRPVQNAAVRVINFFIGFLQSEFAARTCQWVLREVEAILACLLSYSRRGGVAATARRPE